MMDRTDNQVILSWLNDAYAMEQAQIKLLEFQLGRHTDFPEFQDKCRDHLQGQAEMLRSRIEHLGSSRLKTEAVPEVRDAVLISLAQRMKHYEIAGYGSARTFADQVGDEWAAAQLQATLDDENRTDKQLSELAVRVINVRAR